MPTIEELFEQYAESRIFNRFTTENAIITDCIMGAIITLSVLRRSDNICEQGYKDVCNQIAELDKAYDVTRVELHGVSGFFDES